MKDWNVIVGVRDGAFEAAGRAMEPFGQVKRSAIVDVLAMKVADPAALAAQYDALLKHSPRVRDAIVGVVPLTHCFDFDGEEDFANKVQGVIVGRWGPKLKGTKFQILTRRRGYANEVPRKLDRGERENDVVDELGAWGLPRDECDFIITIETLRRRAGLSLWTSEELWRYPFLDLG